MLLSSSSNNGTSMDWFINWLVPGGGSREMWHVEGKSQPVSSRCSVGSIGLGCSNPKFWLVEAPLVGSIAFHLGQ